MENFEIIGYLASGTVLISFLLKKIKHLRIVNSVGCGLFVLYGCMMPELNIPIVVTNVAIIGINIYYLLKK